jgi:hypothetical protein
MQHAWDRCDIYKKFWSEKLKGRDNLEDIGINGKI